MVVQLTFDFEVQLLRSIFQKNGKAMAFVLVQESWKLTKYFESYRDFPRCKVNENGLLQTVLSGKSEAMLGRRYFRHMLARLY